MKQKKIICHDCQKEIGLKKERHIYEVSGREFSKCAECYATDPALRNFQKAEVYSRVVGYIRPVEQWNKGKKEEFSDRLEFAVSDGACC